MSGGTVAAFLVVALATLAACRARGDGQDRPELTGAAAAGERIVSERGCLSCHTTTGRAGTGPTWKGLAGSAVMLEDGRTVTADAEYLRRAVLDPDADTVAGFPPGLMSSSVPKGSISEQDAAAIVAYIETLTGG